MPSTTTTSVTLASLLDLLGSPAAPPQLDKSQLGFDALLQSPSPPPPRPPDDARPDSPPTSEQRPRREGHHPAETAVQPAPAADVSPEPPKPGNKPPASALPPPAASHPSAEAPPDEDASHDGQTVVAQSLAALAVVATPTPPPALPVEPSAPSAPLHTDSTKPKKPAPKSPATVPHAAAAQNTPENASSPGGQHPAASDIDPPGQHTEGPPGAAPKPASVDPAVTSLESIADNERAASQTLNVPHPGSPSAIDQPAGSTSPHQPQHPSASAADAQQLSFQTASPNSTDPAPPPQVPSAPAVAPVAAPLVPSADSLSAGNSSNSTTPQTAVSQRRPRLPAEILSPAPPASSRRAGLEIDSARLLSRIARAFSAAQDRDGAVHLRLSPPELGSLRLDIRVQDGALVAHMHAETDAARAAILDNLPALRDRLADQGIRIERFDVDLMQRQPGGMADQSGGRQPEQAPLLPRLGPASRSRADTSLPSNARPSGAASAGGLNVIV